MTFAKSVAVGASAVLSAGVVTAVVRGADSGSSSPNAMRLPGIARSWVRVADQKVGFVADLPGQPAESARTSHLPDGSPLDAWTATDSHQIVIERFSASAPLPATEIAGVFRDAIDSLARGAGFQVESEGSTTFRGQPAREGVYVMDDGRRYRALIFADGGGDLYLIASPDRYFQAVVTSFRVVIPAGRPLGE